MEAAKNGAGPASTNPARWLLLVHQLPPRPAYLRVKIWRGLRDIGAVALKNAVYVLPRNEQTLRDFRHLLGQIEQGRGEAVLCESGLVAGLGDAQIQELFNAARDLDYQALAKDLRKQGKGREADLNLKLEKARRQLAQIARIDFFGAPMRQNVEALLSQLEHSPIVKAVNPARRATDMPSLTGMLWITRQGVHVDRIACAWLIRRFIDPKARFKFVSRKTYRHTPGELRFDMADAEFTHEDDKCSFEVLLDRMASRDAALIAMGEIIHDLDLKDRKFGRPETSGIGHVIEGICATQNADSDRITRGSALFDDTYERFRRKAARTAV